MKNTYIYTTPEQQIEKLKAQHLKFEDEHQALELLSIYGYYNVINSYSDPYIITDEYGNKIYREGTTFEHIYSLFVLDHHLRISVMSSMIDTEEMLRAALADVISSEFGIDHKQYLKKENYRNRKSSDPRFSLQALLKRMNDRIAKVNSLPLTHYRDQYNAVPPWILFKSLTLAELVNFARQLKPKQLALFIQRVYGVDEITAQKPCMKHLLFDTLHMCREYRNIVAHGGRTYNAKLNSSCRIPSKEDLEYLKIIWPQLELFEVDHGLSLFCMLLSLFAYIQPCLFIANEMKRQMERHIELYPSDHSYLIITIGTILNIEI